MLGQIQIEKVVGGHDSLLGSSRPITVTPFFAKIQRARRAANIFTLDGHCNQSGGMLDPNTRQPKSPRFVFGSMPSGGGICTQVHDLQKAAIGTNSL